MSKTISVETNISASIDDVWSEVSLIENHSNWMNDAEEINFQSTTKSGVGTEIKVLTKIGPIKLYDYMIFTKWEEKKSIGVDHIGIVTGKGEMQFEEISENITKFKWVETLKFPYYLAGPIGEIFGKPIIEFIWKKNLKNLKEIIEK
tara:strand:- start:2200 stop:2640 length:441 start_codon:yes stop_codon:yes gene_type:complete